MLQICTANNCQVDKTFYFTPALVLGIPTGGKVNLDTKEALQHIPLVYTDRQLGKEACNVRESYPVQLVGSKSYSQQEPDNLAKSQGKG